LKLKETTKEKTKFHAKNSHGITRISSKKAHRIWKLWL